VDPQAQEGQPVIDLDRIIRRWDIRFDPDGGPPRAYRVRNSTEDAADVAALVAELRAAREENTVLGDRLQALSSEGLRLENELRAAREARDLCLRAVDKFERDLGFTAPELVPMRIRLLREGIEGAFEPDPEAAAR
jgi:hypothetical protein